MPKSPGAASTRRTFKIEQVVVGSFVFMHETWIWRRPCNIEGCDHRMGPDTTKSGWATEWESCDENQLPAYIALDKPGFPDAGMACPCCVAKILSQT